MAESESSSSSSSSSSPCLVCVLFGLCLALIVILAAVVIYHLNSQVPGPLLTSTAHPRTELATKKRQLYNFVNTSIDPCENFYDFVCDKWTRNKTFDDDDDDQDKWRRIRHHFHDQLMSNQSYSGRTNESMTFTVRQYSGDTSSGISPLLISSSSGNFVLTTDHGDFILFRWCDLVDLPFLSALRESITGLVARRIRTFFRQSQSRRTVSIVFNVVQSNASVSVSSPSQCLNTVSDIRTVFSTSIDFLHCNEVRSNRSSSVTVAAADLSQRDHSQSDRFATFIEIRSGFYETSRQRKETRSIVSKQIQFQRLHRSTSGQFLRWRLVSSTEIESNDRSRQVDRTAPLFSSIASRPSEYQILGKTNSNVRKIDRWSKSGGVFATHYEGSSHDRSDHPVDQCEEYVVHLSSPRSTPRFARSIRRITTDVSKCLRKSNVQKLSLGRLAFPHSSARSFASNERCWNAGQLRFLRRVSPSDLSVLSTSSRSFARNSSSASTTIDTRLHFFRHVSEFVVHRSELLGYSSLLSSIFTQSCDRSSSSGEMSPMNCLFSYFFSTDSQFEETPREQSNSYRLTFAFVFASSPLTVLMKAIH